MFFNAFEVISWRELELCGLIFVYRFFLDNTMQKSCKSCSNLFTSDSATTGFRCGVTYFSQPPVERKMKRMETYPEVNEMDSCDQYRSRVEQLRTDLSTQSRLA